MSSSWHQKSLSCNLISQQMSQFGFWIMHHWLVIGLQKTVNTEISSIYRVRIDNMVLESLHSLSVLMLSKTAPFLYHSLCDSSIAVCATPLSQSVPFLYCSLCHTKLLLHPSFPQIPFLPFLFPLIAKSIIININHRFLWSTFQQKPFPVFDQ